VARAIIARFNIAIFSLFERPLKARPRGEARGVISRDCRRGAYIDSRARARARRPLVAVGENASNRRGYGAEIQSN
jgi:hypothetical protein